MPILQYGGKTLTTKELETDEETLEKLDKAEVERFSLEVQELFQRLMAEAKADVEDGKVDHGFPY